MLPATETMEGELLEESDTSSTGEVSKLFYMDHFQRANSRCDMMRSRGPKTRALVGVSSSTATPS